MAVRTEFHVRSRALVTEKQRPVQRHDQSVGSTCPGRVRASRLECGGLLLDAVIVSLWDTKVRTPNSEVDRYLYLYPGYPGCSPPFGTMPSLSLPSQFKCLDRMALGCMKKILGMNHRPHHRHHHLYLHHHLLHHHRRHLQNSQGFFMRWNVQKSSRFA